MSLLRSVTTIGGWTLISRLTGFARDMLIAAFLGAGPAADAFFVAFKLPNFFRRLFAEGAFNSAFLPLFARKLTEAGPDAAVRFARDALGALLAVLIPLTLLAELFMPALMLAFAPGFASDPDKFALAVTLTRITFPYLLCMSLLALMSGVLNSLDRFAAAAAAPILLNITLILALLALTPQLPSAAHALAIGVALAGVLQLLWLALECRRAGMMLVPARPRATPDIRKLARLMLPGALGAGVVQINLMVDTILASLLPTGAVSFLYYADRVNQLPLGVVGVAIGVALLPALTKSLRSGAAAEADSAQNRALEFTLLLTLPAAAALLAVPGPIVAVLFERGQFGATDGAATAGALAAFAVGLPAYVLIKAFAPGFYAREDTATPVKIAAVAMALNIAFALALMPVMRHIGIALATALSAWINASTLGGLLLRRGYWRPDAQLKRRAPRIFLCSALLALALWFGALGLADAFRGPLALKAAALALLVVGGGALYAALAQVTGAAAFSDLRRGLRRRAA